MSVSGPRRDSIKVDSIGGREYRLGSISGEETEPASQQVDEQIPKRPSVADVNQDAYRRKSVSNRAITGASQITLKQSIVPIVLVTSFFLYSLKSVIH